MEIFLLLFFILIIYGIWKQMPQVKKTTQINTLDNEFDLAFKNLLKANGVKGIDEYTIDELREIFIFIDCEFDKASQERNEKIISKNQKLKILAEVITTSSLMGRDFALNHLDYELQRFRDNGIRKDNKGLI